MTQKWLDLIGLCFATTGEYYPDDRTLAKRAEHWRWLLTDHFFRKEWRYVVRMCCRLRGDRRDAIKADELLRIAEKVYGCSVETWEVENADCDPLVWSEQDSDWIPLEQAIDRITKAAPTIPHDEIFTLIYGEV